MKHNITQWFTESKFGMFVHFGLYSIPQGIWKGKIMEGSWYAEWIQARANRPHGIPKKEYQALAKEFNPTCFNAEEWILEAKNAGMKYFLITAKHHDGFALWPSKVSMYNVVDAAPFKHDILRELSDACKKYGLIFGVYYSHWLDWEFPGGGLPPWPEIKQPSQDEFETYWQKKCLPQVKELVAGYDVKFLWFDCWEKSSLLTDERLDELIKLVRDLSPDCMINSRIGTTWNHSQKDKHVDYISMGDNEFPETRSDFPWETSGTLNRSWGYHALDFGWQSSKSLLRSLIDNASRGGNFQLNIGPMENGKFPAPAIRRLREIGAWLSVNSEGVYGTTPSSCPEPSWGRLTEKMLASGNTHLYAFLYNANSADLIIDGIKGTIASASILETGQVVEYCQTGDSLSFKLPDECDRNDINVIVFDVVAEIHIETPERTCQNCGVYAQATDCKTEKQRC